MKRSVIYALGFFDGVHLGHQALLKACRTLADRCGCKAGVVTFGNHPDALVQGSAPRLINSLSDRKRLLSQFHMDTVLELPFDEDLRSMSWMDFLGMLCRQHQAKGFVCGADFRFGHKGGGTAALLEEYCRTEGLPCAVVPEQKLGDITVSSTHIRALLEAGEVEDANRFLGHPHILSGTVVPGKQLGRTIGVPTANLTLPEGVLCPRRGVYACLAETEYGRHMAVANIGTRPTVEGSDITAEPWLLDFQGDLYGKHLTLELRHFLRPEEKFGSLEELKAAIAADAAKTRVLLKDTGKKL